MEICLAWSPQPREVRQRMQSCPEGSSVRDALIASGILDALDVSTVQVSVWGRKVTPDQVLRDGDRIELCRALQVDPKVARRERFKGQGARGTGLFAKKRPGAKAGY